MPVAGISVGGLENIVIVRALRGLGDLLVMVPALRALRAAAPRAHIALLGLPEAQPFAERFGHYVDELLLFPGFPGLPEQAPRVREFPAFLEHVHGRRFDLAIQMHGDGRTSNLLTALLGARVTAGYWQPGPTGYCPNPDTFLPYPEAEPEIWRNLHLLERLGIPPQGDGLEFPLDEQDRADLRAAPEAAALDGADYVVVHPGAMRRERRWPPEHFATVADRLAGMGYRVVLTGVPAEADITRAVRDHMRAEPIDLTGRTTLGGVAALLSRARLLVSNDTGVSHLAAALRTPSVVVFLTSQRARWAPLDGERHRAVGRGERRDVLFDADNPVEAPPSRVAPGDVLAEAEDLLRKEPV